MSMRTFYSTRATITLAAALLLLPLRPLAPVRADDQPATYRVRGTFAPGRDFVGDLTLTSTGDGATARQVVRFADGTEWVVEGKGVRAGKALRIAIDGGSTGIIHALSGKDPASGKPGMLEIDLGADTLRSRYVGPDGKADAVGVASRIAWSQAKDLRPEAALDWWNRHGEFATITGVGGVRLATAVFRAKNEKAAIVFAPGRTETFTKYAELVRDLQPRGYSFYFIDHRGQGRSGPLVGKPAGPPDFVSPPGHVDRFDDYVEDLTTFVDSVVRAEPHRQVVGWGHSMGGGIVTRFAEEHPDRLDALILNSPMHGLQIKWYERAFVNLACTFGWRRSFALGQKPWKPSEDRFETNDLTKSPERFRYKLAIVEQDPSLWLGGPTYGWVREAVRAGKEMRADARKLTMPVLLFQSGEDSLVDNAAQDAIAAAAPDCTKVVFPDARHELLMERDAIRDAVLDRVLEFLESLGH